MRVEGDLNARNIVSEGNIAVDGRLDVLGDAKSYRSISAGYMRAAGSLIAGSLFSADGMYAQDKIVGVAGIGARGPISGRVIWCDPGAGIWAYSKDGLADCEIRAGSILPSARSIKRGFFTRVRRA
jgi:hypothetical protein